MLLAVTGLTGITIVCYWFLNPVMVILFAAVNAFLAGMIEISCYTTFFDTLTECEGDRRFFTGAWRFTRYSW